MRAAIDVVSTNHRQRSATPLNLRESAIVSFRLIRRRAQTRLNAWSVNSEPSSLRGWLVASLPCTKLALHIHGVTFRALPMGHPILPDLNRDPGASIAALITTGPIHGFGHQIRDLKSSNLSPRGFNPVRDSSDQGPRIPFMENRTLSLLSEK